MSAGAIGIDLGGSNLRVAGFAPGSAVPLVTHREPVGEDRRPEAIVARVAAAVAATRRAARWPDDAEVAVGVGLAAMLSDRQGTVARSPHLDWTDVPFGPMLARTLDAVGAGAPRHQLGVYNDVNAITWGELTAGAGRGARDLLLVFGGTGLGGGVVTNGQLVEGSSNCAGEIGHVKVAWGDKAAPCACGQRGCVEAYVGGSYVQRRARAELRAGVRSTALALAGGVVDHVHPGHVDQAAAAGDAWALELWGELAPLLAVTIGNACAVLNPERVVLGGGMLGRTPTLVELTLAALAVATPVAIHDRLTVVMAELEDDAGLVGAAALAAAGVSVLR
ncbi:MAG: ROK family protein [Kofleriaceae bacterium]|nr:ROK family protein [Kofleriaceae bacterium]MBP6836290.1 ROK family protein [Kofleriaceae bacterium]MBP9204632.1 ROK family protein [Kofleriaceae bacterium]